MKRDMELIRKLLKRIENEADGQGEVNMKFAGYGTSQIMYNARLALQHGLIEGTTFRQGGDAFFIVRPTGLTWEGHELLDSIRNDFLWQKAQLLVQKSGGFASFQMMKEVMESSAKLRLGL